jgi:hypothetical protein
VPVQADKYGPEVVVTVVDDPYALPPGLERRQMMDLLGIHVCPDDYSPEEHVQLAAILAMRRSMKLTPASPQPDGPGLRWSRGGPTRRPGPQSPE